MLASGTPRHPLAFGSITSISFYMCLLIKTVSVAYDVILAWCQLNELLTKNLFPDKVTFTLEVKGPAHLFGRHCLIHHSFLSSPIPNVSTSSPFPHQNVPQKLHVLLYYTELFSPPGHLQPKCIITYPKSSGWPWLSVQQGPSFLEPRPLLLSFSFSLLTAHKWDHVIHTVIYLVFVCLFVWHFAVKPEHLSMPTHIILQHAF